MITIKLNTKDLSKLVLEEYELEEGGTVKGIKGISVPSVYKEQYIVASIEEEYDLVILKCTDGTYLTNDFIKSIAIEGGRYNNTTTANITTIGTKYIKVGKYYITKDLEEVYSEEELPVCSECGELLDVEGSPICSKCLEKHTKLNSYSYKPEYKFIGTQRKADKDNNIWYGLEVENSYNKQQLGLFVYKNKESVYLKSDSSIRGTKYNAEVVTMPHSFDELMKEDGLLDSINKIDTEEDREENGCHIHISRTAWKNTRHYQLWYYLFHKNKELVEHIAGRKETAYCKHKLSDTKIHKKKFNKNDRERSLAINEANDATIEVRVFQGTTDSIKLKTYVQFLDSLLKYTKYYTKKVSLEKWYEYVVKYKSKYSELLYVLEQYSSPIEGSIEYKEPKIREVSSIRELTTEDISNICLAVYKGKEYSIRSIHSVFYEEDGKMGLSGYMSNGNSFTMYEKDISKILVEEV